MLKSTYFKYELNYFLLHAVYNLFKVLSNHKAIYIKKFYISKYHCYFQNAFV